jgi:hypothetical protein
MFEKELIFHCAPALAGIKTANLFRYKVLERQGVYKVISLYRQIFQLKGVEIRILSQNESSVLIYVYRPEKLKKDFNRKRQRECLQQYGYNVECLEDAIQHLSQRIEEQNEFPHEIGLFLGFPVEDVLGFIENKGRNCKYTGCWKVYFDVAESEKQFARFKRCTEVYNRCYEKGTDISRLCVNSALI